ncbi:uncharacterized protein MONOS_14492 [Monocercomonoides exilis]|uniref:uncharacterized protein n=1 Tax=Monocercomonoides exilis TaxID=2049356 RepID=UPI00355A94A6|nr:hypothetical protein MONOS_14492 [Monocercomonoides exilis]|eukprot:MONOS_14492.1-p1 / transcript=MONOS_14492.1 / gene=MONOS_14492 / organism=Monocercomonoides_exilis_PA203 / gene_product=unspecified product / transcript_product=unspecified product / location=Mono_scaffold01012:6328-7597(-) / protein_length=390 / sequence_SO=supercontig / SO=protein_coding / is_pseudo=false
MESRDGEIEKRYATRYDTTEEDSTYSRVMRQMSEMRNEKIVWRVSGTVSESPTGTALEVSSKTAIEDTLEGEGNTQMQPGHKIPEVMESAASGPLREPLPGRQVNRLSEWKKIGGDKLVSREKSQTRFSRDEGDDEQSFIPLGGRIEGRSGEAHTGVGGEVVQPDIHGDKEEWKVEKDLGLQSSKRGSAGKALQDGLPGDSGGTPGGERLDDHSGHIECIPACQIGRTVQSLSVLQLSKSLLRLRGDAFWSERSPRELIKIMRRAASYIREHWKGSFEIDLTGDSPVPEESGLDTIGGETEIGTHKECGIFGMAVEFREDRSDAPIEEESAAARGCANMDSTCKGKKETKDERLSRTPRETEFCEAEAPNSELVDEAHAIWAESGDSPR